MLPCAMPSPAIRLQALSQEDAASNNERTLVRNETLTNTSSTRDLEIRSGGGDILFGTYQFSANFSGPNSSIGFAVSKINKIYFFLLKIHAAIIAVASFMRSPIRLYAAT